MNKIIKILEGARTLLSDEAHWIKHDLAKTSAGQSFESESEMADYLVYGEAATDPITCFCLEGAIAFAALSLESDLEKAENLVKVTCSVVREVTGKFTWIFNDSPTTDFAKVRAALTSAIGEAANRFDAL